MKRLTRLLVLMVLVSLCLGQTPIPTPVQMVPGFSIRPYAPRVGMEVEFKDYSVGPVVDWLWDFGDGTTSIFQNPVHIFTSTGDFTITLTIKDAEGVQVTLTKRF